MCSPHSSNGARLGLIDDVMLVDLTPVSHGQYAAMGLVVCAALGSGWTTGSGMEGPPTVSRVGGTGRQEVLTLPWSLFSLHKITTVAHAGGVDTTLVPLDEITTVAHAGGLCLQRVRAVYDQGHQSSCLHQ
jgi:hypothetical protein|uniref:Uncharacterized protein n=1 Tax=Zea mays TaxID=4577 RepID=A0A804QPR0_MAIZE